MEENRPILRDTPASQLSKNSMSRRRTYDCPMAIRCRSELCDQA